MYTKQISAKVVDEIFNEIVEIANERGYNLGEYIRHFVNDDVEKRRG